MMKEGRKRPPEPSDLPHKKTDDDGALTAAPVEAGAAHEATELKRYLEKRLETAIAEHAVRLNEGNNGIIMRMTVEDMPKDLREDLQKIGIEAGEGGAAVKILKIYRPGIGKAEYDNQRRAYEIASKKEGNPAYARVPRPYLFKDIPITEETRKTISNRNENFRATDRVEVLVMDYVPGEDLATLVFKEVIRRHPKSVHLRDAVEEMGFNDLHEEVRRIFSFEKPGGKARDEGERIHEEIKVEGANKRKVFDFLLKDGVQIDPAVSAQLENAITLMHENGFTIRDGHQRNIMVTGDLFVRPDAPEQEPPQTYIIDFANAVSFESGLDEETIRGRYLRTADTEGKNYPDPRVPLRDIAPLTVSPAERAMDPELDDAKKLRSEIDALRTRLERQLEKRPDARLETYERSLEATASAKNLADKDPRLIHLYQSHPYKVRPQVHTLLVSLERLEAEGKIENGDIDRFLERLEPILPQAEKNAITDYRKGKKAAS